MSRIVSGSVAGQFHSTDKLGSGLAARVDGPWFALLILAFIAFLIRAPHFGNPVITVDEQFYLLVGDRMLHGALPYVDIWDRKPIGLFLIYAGCRLLGGSGVVFYQVVATLFVIATATCISLLCRKVAGWIGATIAGMVYIVWLEVAEGSGGQSPVFYSLFTAAAAALLHDGTLHGYPAFRARAFMAMALIGIGIQIKYTVVFEGAFFGLLAAAGLWRGAHSTKAGLRDIGLLVAAVLAPTGAALAVYAVIGHAHEFWFANFTSVFLRGPTPPRELAFRTHMALLRLLPFTIAIAAATFHLRADRREETRHWQRLVLGWMATAIIGFFSLGVLPSHYLLPVFVPFAAGTAPIYRRLPAGPVLAGFMLWIPASHFTWLDLQAARRSQQQMVSLAKMVPADVTSRCLMVFDGPPALYLATHSCALTRYLFPDHLSADMERGATGVDAVAEVGRILARRPAAIAVGDTLTRPPNPQTTLLLRATLATDYRRVGAMPIDGRAIAIYIPR